jgi:hypothetical protein
MLISLIHTASPPTAPDNFLWLTLIVYQALPGDDTDTRASLITQQINIADPCTFRLVVKVNENPETLAHTCTISQ